MLRYPQEAAKFYRPLSSFLEIKLNLCYFLPTASFSAFPPPSLIPTIKSLSVQRGYFIKVPPLFEGRSRQPSSANQKYAPSSPKNVQHGNGDSAYTSKPCPLYKREKLMVSYKSTALSFYCPINRAISKSFIRQKVSITSHSFHHRKASGGNHPEKNIFESTSSGQRWNEDTLTAFPF